MDIIHNATLFIEPQQCLIQQVSFSNWEAIFGDNCLYCHSLFEQKCPISLAFRINRVQPVISIAYADLT